MGALRASGAVHRMGMEEWIPIVAAADPRALFGVVESPGMEGIANEVRERLVRALDVLVAK